MVLCSSRVARAQFTVTGSPSTLRVQTAVAGLAPAPVSDNSTSYTYKSPGPKNKKITAQLNAPMPSGVTLQVTLQAPSGAVSIPNVTLDATARDVVTGVPRRQDTPLSITYTLSATLDAGVVPPQSRTVTLTIVSSP
jgi:hypothetical protein